MLPAAARHAGLPVLPQCEFPAICPTPLSLSFRSSTQTDGHIATIGSKKLHHHKTAVDGRTPSTQPRQLRDRRRLFLRFLRFFGFPLLPFSHDHSPQCCCMRIIIQTDSFSVFTWRNDLSGAYGSVPAISQWH